MNSVSKKETTIVWQKPIKEEKIIFSAEEKSYLNSYSGRKYKDVNFRDFLALGREFWFKFNKTYVPDLAPKMILDRFMSRYVRKNRSNIFDFFRSYYKLRTKFWRFTRKKIVKRTKKLKVFRRIYKFRELGRKKLLSFMNLH